MHVPNDSDLFRVVLYTGYRFTTKILFNSEIEFEHQHELSVEFAYLDFLLSDAIGLRVGNVLVPMGFVNELHEPAVLQRRLPSDGGAEPHPDHLERERARPARRGRPRPLQGLRARRA